jgi:hypothetical protein
MGAAATFRRVAAQAFAFFYRYEDDIVLVKTLTDTAAAPDHTSFRIEIATDEHLHALVRFAQGCCRGRLTSRFGERMAAGAQAFLGFMDDEIIGYYWWVDTGGASAAVPLFSRYGIELGPQDVYGFDLFVAPGHRGGTAARFLASVESRLNALGYRRVWGYVASSNRPARWLFSAAGHQVVGRVRSQVLLSRVFRLEGKVYLARGGALKRIAFPR